MTQKIAKNRHLRTISQLCRTVSSMKACIDNRKNLLNSNIFSTCLNMANFGPLTAEVGSGVCGTRESFNGFRALPSLLQRHRSPEANQTLHDVWPSPGLVHYTYIFGGSCPMTEFYPVQYSLYVQVLRSPIFAGLLHGSPAAVVSQTLRRGTRNGITELSQTTPPIFGWAAITLSIGPHSSLFVCLSICPHDNFQTIKRRMMKLGG